MSDQQHRPPLPEPLRDSDNAVAILLARQWRRLNIENEHWMFCIVGREGSGKSYTALKIANQIDPDFSADRVLFSGEELLKRLRDGDNSQGNVYVLDEAGVSLGRRTWQEKGQILFNQALQLVRNHNLGLIFTLPRLSELDSQAKGRLQGFLEITEKEPGEYVRGKWKRLDPDRADMTGEVYQKYPTVNGWELTSVAFSPPDDDLAAAYEEQKRGFQEQMYDRTLAELSDEDEADEEELSVADYVDRVKSEGGVAPYLSWHGGHHKWTLSKQKLRESYDLSVREAKHLKDRLVEDPEIDIQAAGAERDGSPDTTAETHTHAQTDD